MSIKRIWPFLAIGAGLCLLIGGFIYDIFLAGIPYQDPTPEMSAGYARHSLIASATRWIGVGAFLVGVITSGWRFRRGERSPLQDVRPAG
jgi:hypothetical protein